MIAFDITKTGRASHHSGLTRVSASLRHEFGAHAEAVAWSEQRRAFVVVATDEPVAWSPGDWLLTPELFSEPERPGFSDFIRAKPCRLAAIFHDAIPLHFPEITWPQSVKRHPEYVKMLGSFDRIWAVSKASRDDLLGWWQRMGLAHPPPVGVLTLGADFNGNPRVQESPLPPPALLMVGILEPRKNQAFLLNLCAGLWDDGLTFELHLVGRVNPHFGKPVHAQIRRMQRRRAGLSYHVEADDRKLSQLYRRARAAVFPTIAEGCGLPVLEALWLGVPVVCSDLPVLRENADAGGCWCVPVNDAYAWRHALRTLLTDDGAATRLRAAATARPLPRWRDTADTLLAGLA